MPSMSERYWTGKPFSFKGLGERPKKKPEPPSPEPAKPRPDDKPMHLDYKIPQVTTGQSSINPVIDPDARKRRKKLESSGYYRSGK